MVWYDYNLEKEEKPLNNKLLNRIDYSIDNSDDTRGLNFLLSVKEKYYENCRLSSHQIKVINEIYNEIKDKNDKFLNEIIEGIC